jgi:hypothetical protein
LAKGDGITRSSGTRRWVADHHNSAGVYSIAHLKVVGHRRARITHVIVDAHRQRVATQATNSQNGGLQINAIDKAILTTEQAPDIDTVVIKGSVAWVSSDLYLQGCGRLD